MMKRLLPALCAILFFGFAIQAQRFKTFPGDPIKVKQTVLKNGLTVMLSENHDAPEIFGAIVVNAGAKNDPSTATGIAHYLEHMLFKGTQTFGTSDWKNEEPLIGRINQLYEELAKSKDDKEKEVLRREINEMSVRAAQYALPNELDRMLSSIGSRNINAYTTYDQTVYYNSFPASQVPKWLDLYAERFKDPVFRLFQAELETVYEEKNISNDDVFARVFETFNKRLFKNHPYGQQTVLGSVEHLKNPSLFKMYEFFNTYYVANNMALIMSGDFNADEILPIIEKRFGTWRNGTLPDSKLYENDTIVYRNLFKEKLTPVRVGLIGYLTPSKGHEDQAALDICNQLLSNEAGCGLLDRMKVDGKILECGLEYLDYNDQGAGLVYFVPKLVGQKMLEAERQVRYRIEKLKNADFSNELFEAVKMNLLSNFQQKWESNDSRVEEMAKSFSLEKEWGDYLRYGEKLSKITIEETKAVADRYYNRNFLVMWSKPGFPKKEKLKKPGYTPVVTKNEEVSEYRKSFEKIKAKEPESNFVDFEKEIETVPLAVGCTLKVAKNPFNDVFSMTIRMGKGNFKDPVLPYVAEYLKLVGPAGYDFAQFREALFHTGCSVDFKSTDEAFIIEFTGLETGIEAGFQLLSRFLKNPDANNKMANRMAHQVKVKRKFEATQPEITGHALKEFALFGENSSYVRDLTDKEINSYNGKELVKHLRGVWDTEMDVFYVGKRKSQDVAALFSKYFEYPTVLYPKTKRMVFEQNLPKENTVYFIEREDAIQSHIYFNLPGKVGSLKEEAMVQAFNKYFGDDMSSVVFQDIREFRSLAYSTWARYYSAPVSGKKNWVTGYVGCQGDKTLEAMDAMVKLFHAMPLYHERTEAIKSSLIQDAQSSRPFFRDFIPTVEKWIEKGYTMDPGKQLLEEYKTIEFGQIAAFYQKEVAKKPITITVVGDPKQFDIAGLMKFGTVIFVKEKKVFPR